MWKFLYFVLKVIEISTFYLNFNIISNQKKYNFNKLLKKK